MPSPHRMYKPQARVASLKLQKIRQLNRIIYPCLALLLGFAVINTWLSS